LGEKAKEMRRCVKGVGTDLRVCAGSDGSDNEEGFREKQRVLQIWAGNLPRKRGRKVLLETIENGRRGGERDENGS